MPRSLLNQRRGWHTLNQDQLLRKDRFRRLVPHWIKGAIIRTACSDLAGRIIATAFRDRIPHRGSTILTHSPRISPATKAMLFFKIYERSEIEQAQAFLAPGYDVIECGASIGANTLQIARRATGKVVAVEADPVLAEVLRDNLAENLGPQHQCVVVNAAVDYSGASAVKFAVGSDSLRGYVGASLHDPAHSTVEVPAVTLEVIIEKHEIGKFILVLDVEGAEAALFLHAHEALKNCYRIIGELDGGVSNEKWYSIQDLIRYLAEIGFRRIHGQGNRMVFQNESDFSANHAP